MSHFTTHSAKDQVIFGLPVERVSVPYAQLRPAQERIARALRSAGDRRWPDVAQCCAELQVRICKECGLAHARPNFSCKHRLCPTCQVRRSRRLALQALEVYKAAGDRLALVQMRLITLTQKNVKADDLSAEIDKLLTAVTKLRHLRAWRNFVIGAARNIEITYNPQTRTYHPHVHLIVWLSPLAPREMDEKTWWAQQWRGLMNLGYNPVCDCRPIKDQEGSIFEVSKYVCKAAELSSLPPRTLAHVCAALNVALKNRRLIAYSGLWQKIRAELCQVDPDQLPDEPAPAQICGCGSALADAVMRWNGNEYRFVEAIKDRVSR